MIQIAIFNRLQGLVDGRVFPGIAPPEEPAPRITYVLPSDIHSFTFYGRNGHRDVTVQVDCWARDSFTAEELSLRVMQAMEAAPAGEEQDEPFSVTEISRVGEEYEAGTGLFRVTYEYDLTI